MKTYISDSHDPRYNLALEEYLFENLKDDLFMLWRNGKSVIIGKNQNAYSEVNLNYAKENGIFVIRRITGGGAVFHDLGNINYTFLSEHGEEKNFEYFTRPIIDALVSLGVKARFSGRNDIVLSDGRKISGNARCERNGRVMHHGTLLFDTDMSFLSNVLNVNPEKIKSKGVKSVKSRVGNISEELPEKISPEQFINMIDSYVGKLYHCERLTLTGEDEEGISRLRAEKYDTDSWNLSTNLPYEINTVGYYDFGLVELSFTVRENKIPSLKIYGDFFGKKNIEDIERAIIGCAYDKSEILKVLKGKNISDYIAGPFPEQISQDLCDLFFKI